jgi:hypothetical protein
MDTVHKMHVKLADAEFSAEGSEEAVQRQYEAFLVALEQARSAPRTPPSPPAAGVNHAKRDAPEVGAADAALLSRVFKHDSATGIVSLRALPRGENQTANAILLLLYGFAELRNEHDVSIIQLGKAAKQSGSTFERADRTLLAAGYMDLVTKAGTKSGGRYGLNNRGATKAQELLASILG